MSDGWLLTISYQAQMDLFVFPWSRDVERGGALCGRWERPGITPVDDGKSLFIRRVFPADRDCTPESLRFDHSDIFRKQTLAVPSRPGSSGGLYGKDDVGEILGDIHSHVLVDKDGDTIRELSGPDLRNAAALALTPSAVPGRPWLSTIATPSETWFEGLPAVDWDDVRLDHYLVFPDERVVRPTVVLQSELEWEVEEAQHMQLATGGN